MADSVTNAAPPVKAAPADPKAVVAAKPVDAEPTQEFIVNGKPVKLTAAQVKVAVQKGLFADQKMKGFDVMKGKTESLINSLKTPEGILSVLKDPALGANPKEVFKKLMASDVIDDELKDAMSKWVYDNVVQKEKMTPEQLENDKKLSDYERLKKAEEANKAKNLSDQQAAQVQQVYQAVRAEVTKQILADKTFPQTEGSIRSVIEKLRVMNKQGAAISSESVAKALGLVKKDHILHQQTMFDALDDPEALISMFGEARALKISKALVARIQAKQKAKGKTEVKEPEGEVREKTTDRIDRKLGRTSQGYTVLDV